MTLTTASAAALTIGLASPALALATTVGGIGAVHQTGFGAHQSALHTGMHHIVALPKGDDDDGDDDGGGDEGGDAEIGGIHRSHHGGGRGLCGVGGHIGGLAQVTTSRWARCGAVSVALRG
jgi:hypothetical protein